MPECVIILYASDERVIVKLQLTEVSLAAWWQGVCQLSTGLGGPESDHLSFLWTHKIHIRWLGCSALPVLQKEKTFFFFFVNDFFHIVIISTKLLHLLAGARHRLPPLWLAAEGLHAAYHWLPEGEWEEHSPHPSPVAERVKAKTPSLPIIWVTLGFGVCLRVCVYGGERKEIKRERVREGQISSICSPPFSLPISLSLHPSSLFLDHPSALSQTRIPQHLPDHPRTLWLSRHFSIPATGISAQVSPV